MPINNIWHSKMFFDTAKCFLMLVKYALILVKYALMLVKNALMLVKNALMLQKVCVTHLPDQKNVLSSWEYIHPV